MHRKIYVLIILTLQLPATKHNSCDPEPWISTTGTVTLLKLECAASNGNKYPPYPQVMATAISQ